MTQARTFGEAMPRHASRLPPPPRMQSMTMGLPTVIRHRSMAASFVKAKADELATASAPASEIVLVNPEVMLQLEKSAAIPDIGRPPQNDFGAIRIL
jgi:hypothetical protein